MAIPVAPTITQTVTTSPVTAGTPVADLLAAEAETYATTSAEFAVTGTQLTAIAEVPAGAYSVAVTATNVEGTSPEGTASLTFADEVVDPPPAGNASWEEMGDDPNPQAPPIPYSTPADQAPADAWKAYLVEATRNVVPRAKGEDFIVARATKYAPLENVYWNDAVLGPRPTAEIEAEAQKLFEMRHT